ncbi:MAG: hypothetical protein K0R65_926 [Crocinitomicaceae bacterium]|jgi:hypothetical protein|nr:hypothetical protein [Crocinitomicaceae bacterium]
MKFLIVLFVLVSSFSFSQDKIFEAKVANSADFAANKSKGEFYFTFPSATKKETVAKNAAYYTKFFSVQYDEQSHLVTIKMVDNDQSSRQIINRFLISSNITQIEMDGTLYKVGEFYDKKIR